MGGWRLWVPVLLAALLASAAGVSSPATADDAGTASAGSNPAAGRFGFIAPSVRGATFPDVTRRDRYAETIARAIAATASFTIVTIPPHSSTGLDLQALCKSMNIVGIVEPYVGWQNTATDATATAMAVVTDCHGAEFFRGQALDAGKADSAASNDAQIDARMTAAATRLGQAFTTFAILHADAWKALDTGAPLRPLFKQDALVAELQAGANCGTAYNAGHFIQAIALCNEADADDLFGSPAATLMHAASQTNSERSAAVFSGIGLVGIYCFQANAHAALGEPAMGRPEADKAFRWMRTLTDYVRAGDPKNANPDMQHDEDIIGGLRANLLLHFTDPTAPK